MLFRSPQYKLHQCALAGAIRPEDTGDTGLERNRDVGNTLDQPVVARRTLKDNTQRVTSSRCSRNVTADAVAAQIAANSRNGVRQPSSTSKVNPNTVTHCGASNIS